MLSNTGIQWSDVLVLGREAEADGFPSLRELHLESNGISHLCDAESKAEAGEAGSKALPAVEAQPFLNRLELLNLSDNGGETTSGGESKEGGEGGEGGEDKGNTALTWNEVWRLRDLAGLQRLVLNHNRIAEVWYDDVHTSTPPFRALESLSLSHTDIASWQTIYALDKFPALRDVRLRHVPLLESLSPAAARQGIIARMRRLQQLNASEVRGRERSDAETLYLRAIAHEALDLWRSGKLGDRPAGSSADSKDEVEELEAALGLNGSSEEDCSKDQLRARALVESMHPRFTELWKKYGDAAFKTSVRPLVVLGRLRIISRFAGDRRRPDPLLLHHHH